MANVVAASHFALGLSAAADEDADRRLALGRRRIDAAWGVFVMQMDHQEGYADGLAGAGMQDQFVRDHDMNGTGAAYASGFYSGSIDRKAMLTRHADAFAAQRDGQA